MRFPLGLQENGIFRLRYRQTRFSVSLPVVSVSPASCQSWRMETLRIKKKESKIQIMLFEVLTATRKAMNFCKEVRKYRTLNSNLKYRCIGRYSAVCYKPHNIRAVKMPEYWKCRAFGKYLPMNLHCYMALLPKDGVYVNSSAADMCYLLRATTHGYDDHGGKTLEMKRRWCQWFVPRYCPNLVAVDGNDDIHQYSTYYSPHRIIFGHYQMIINLSPLDPRL